MFKTTLGELFDAFQRKEIRVLKVPSDPCLSKEDLCRIPRHYLDVIEEERRRVVEEAKDTLERVTKEIKSVAKQRDAARAYAIEMAEAVEKDLFKRSYVEVQEQNARLREKYEEAIRAANEAQRRASTRVETVEWSHMINAQCQILREDNAKLEAACDEAKKRLSAACDLLDAIKSRIPSAFRPGDVVPERIP
jgi:myosin heavy subunit